MKPFYKYEKVLAMSEWIKCYTLEDAFNWHKRFTPWFSEEYCRTLAYSYEADMKKLLTKQSEAEAYKLASSKSSAENKENQTPPPQTFTPFETLYLKSLYY